MDIQSHGDSRRHTRLSLASTRLTQGKENFMSALGDTAKTLVAGGVMIGMATAVLLPGRPTIGVVKAIGDAGTGYLGTAIKG